MGAFCQRVVFSFSLSTSTCNKWWDISKKCYCTWLVTFVGDEVGCCREKYQRTSPVSTLSKLLTKGVLLEEKIEIILKKKIIFFYREISIYFILFSSSSFSFSCFFIWDISLFGWERISTWVMCLAYRTFFSKKYIFFLWMEFFDCDEVEIIYQYFNLVYQN